MSGFAAGLLGGLARGMESAYDQNVTEKEKKKERAFKMMQAGIEQYNSDKQRRGKYRKAAQALYQRFPDVDKRAIHSAVNMHEGDPLAAMKDIYENRYQYVEPQSQEQQMAALVGTPTQPGTDTAPQVQNGSMGVSGAPTGGSGGVPGMSLGGDEEVSFFGRMMGKQPDREIFNEVAQELGMDGAAFQQYMSGAGLDYELPTGDGYIMADPAKLDTGKIRQELATQVIRGASFGDVDRSAAMQMLQEAPDGVVLELASMAEQPAEGIFGTVMARLRKNGQSDLADQMEVAYAERQAHGTTGLQKQLQQKVATQGYQSLTPQEKQTLFIMGDSNMLMFMLMRDPAIQSAFFGTQGGGELPDRAGIEAEPEASQSRSSGMQQSGPEDTDSGNPQRYRYNPETDELEPIS